MRILGRILLGASLIVSLVQCFAVQFTFDEPSEQKRYQALISELRCLVCQNQSLADSNADLAQDMRQQVYDMITSGSTDGEIIDFMVARFGDFVLYRPPLNPKTLLLWIGPFVLCIGAVCLLIAVVRKRGRAVIEGDGVLTDADQRRAAELLRQTTHDKDA
jgi:cytochrome c-type biogenesis protein CcmH